MNANEQTRSSLTCLLYNSVRSMPFKRLLSELTMLLLSPGLLACGRGEAFLTMTTHGACFNGALRVHARRMRCICIGVKDL
jgi:hypothetical protein